MFKLCNQLILKDYYVKYKKEEKDKINELKIVLNYLFNLDYYIINCKSYYEKYCNKQNTIYIEIENFNKLSNNITKLRFCNTEYSNNLPLHLKWLIYNKVNCNLPPNIIYLTCNYCDIYNLPKSLIFLATYTNIHNEIILNNINIKEYVTKLLYHYLNSILNNNIKIINWDKNISYFK